MDLGSMIGKIPFFSANSLFTFFLYFKYFTYGLYIFAGIFLFTFLRYKFIVIKRSQRGSGQKISISLGRKVVDRINKAEKLKVGVFRGHEEPFPSTTHVNPFMIGIECVEYYVDAGDRWHPMSFGFAGEKGSEPFLFPEEQDHKAWYVQEVRKTNDIYAESLLSKYANVIVPFVMIGVCFITVVLTYKQLDNAIALGNNVISAMSSIQAPPVVP